MPSYIQRIRLVRDRGYTKSHILSILSIYYLIYVLYSLILFEDAVFCLSLAGQVLMRDISL